MGDPYTQNKNISGIMFSGPVNRLLYRTSPDFAPTKFFAGRGAGHEAVVSYRKCSATKQLRENLLARRVNFLFQTKYSLVSECLINF